MQIQVGDSFTYSTNPNSLEKRTEEEIINTFPRPVLKDVLISKANIASYLLVFKKFAHAGSYYKI